MLDTASFPPRQRRDAFIGAISTRDVPLQVSFDPTVGPLFATLDFWEFNSGMRLVQNFDSGISMVRSTRELRVAAHERMAITLRQAGSGTFKSGNDARVLAPGVMFINDHTDTAELVHQGAGDTRALQIEYSLLDVDVDRVRRAAAGLPHSPMYGMFRTHLVHLTSVADKFLDDDAARAMLTTSTLQLARVLIASAAGNERAARDALRESEVARVAVYIREHLRDRDLSAAKIARANHMSMRQLYKIWSTREMTLAEHIIAGRLRGASRDLLKEEFRHLTVAGIAASWGFVSAAHFGKRFRDAYGESPYAWRRQTSPSDERSAASLP